MQVGAATTACGYSHSVSVPQVNCITICITASGSGVNAANCGVPRRVRNFSLQFSKIMEFLGGTIQFSFSEHLYEGAVAVGEYVSARLAAILLPNRCLAKSDEVNVVGTNPMEIVLVGVIIK